MDNISFSGIKNMGYISGKIAENNEFIGVERFMNISLTGKDLHKFRSALKRSHLSKQDYIHPIQNNALNLNTFSNSNEDFIILNYNMLEVNDKNLPMFTELARITRKIKNKKDSNFLIERKFLKKTTFVKPLLIGKHDNLPSRMYEPFLIKNGADKINKVIQRIMEKYFVE